MAKPGTAAEILMDAEVGKPVVLDAWEVAAIPRRSRTCITTGFHYAESGRPSTESSPAADHDRQRGQPAGGSKCAPIKAACRPEWLPLRKCSGAGVAHVILAVTDDGTPPLTSYRRR